MIATRHPLKTFRHAQKPPLTQKDLAIRLGVVRETVARWELGYRLIDDGLLPTIVAATGIPAADLRPDLAKLFGVINSHNGSKGKR